jgi:hypothetical protein
VGGISLTGTGGNGSGVGNLGVEVTGSVAAAGGALSATGTGGGGTGNDQYGVQVNGAGAVLTNTGTGTITLMGTGGGSGNSNRGIGVEFTGGVVSTVNGNLAVTGVGAGHGTGGTSYGIDETGAVIKTTGSGNITAIGTGGDGGGSGAGQVGIFDIFANGFQTTGGGNISLTGQGGASSGNSNVGIYLNAGTVTAAGSGAITVSGTGAGSGNSGTDYGIELNAAGALSTVNGNLTVATAQGGGAGAGVSNYGLFVTGAGSTLATTGSGNISVSALGGQGGGGTNTGTVVAVANGIETTGSGNVTVMTNTLTLSAANDINSIGNLTIQPETANTTVGIGTGAGTLSLPNNDFSLGYLAWGAGKTLTIGGANAGAMDINTVATFANPAVFETGSTGNIILDNTLTSSVGSGNSLVLASGQNFINNVGATAINPGGGRWLVYSTNPASDTINSLSNNFRRFSCVYGGSCPAFPAAGNGFLYTTTPVLTATPGALGITYGSAAPSLTGYGYTLSGYLGSDGAADSLSGALNGTTSYTPASNVGTYNINYASGSLASAMGYSFSYVNNPAAITVNPAALTITANSFGKTYGNTYSFLGTEFTDTGLVNGDTVGSVNLASAGAAGTATVAGGPYSITGSAATGTGLGNYTITYNNGSSGKFVGHFGSNPR